MKWTIRKYYKTAKGHFLILFLIIFLMSACMADYHLVTYPVAYQSGTPYTTFTQIVAEADDPPNLILDSISTVLERGFQTLGLKKDSLSPELIFIMRWETHFIGRHSSATNNKEVMHTYSSTNSVYSPIENTSDKLKNSSSDNKARYYDENSFYRIQAIDAIKNELVWSVKIYSRKANGLRAESIPLLARDLTRSFAQVQVNNSKLKSDGNYHN